MKSTEKAKVKSEIISLNNGIFGYEELIKRIEAELKLTITLKRKTYLLALLEEHGNAIKVLEEKIANLKAGKS